MLLQSRSIRRRKLSIVVLRSREQSCLTIGVCMKSVIARSLTSIQQSLSWRKGCQQEAIGRVQRRASKDAPAIHASIKCAGIRSLPVMAEHKQGPEHSSLRKPVERPNKPVIEIHSASRQCKHNQYIFGNVTQ